MLNSCTRIEHQEQLNTQLFSFAPFFFFLKASDVRQKNLFRKQDLSGKYDDMRE